MNSGKSSKIFESKAAAMHSIKFGRRHLCLVIFSWAVPAIWEN
jgi:hypothetical protein